MKRISIVLVNCIIIIAVILSTFAYVNSVDKISTSQSEEKFADTTSILEEIASNYLEDMQAVSDRWAALINGTGMTMNEAIAMMEKMVVQNGISAQIIWSDSLTGMASVGKASDPENHFVDYSKDSLREIFNNTSKTDSLYVTSRYSDPQTGRYVVAFCNDVKLLDGGKERAAIILYVVPLENLEEHWTFPTEYGDDALVGVIDSSGNYMVKPAEMKNENFFNYIYVYNKGNISEDGLKAEMAAEGTGTFKAYDAGGDMCMWAYSKLSNNSSWFLVTAIPQTSLSGSGVDLTIPAIILVSLLALFIINLQYVSARHKEEDQSHKAMNAQRSIITALAEDYVNVFTAEPEKDYAEIIKLDGYVTNELSKDTKGFSIERIVGNYARDRVHPEDKEAFKDALSDENLIKMFEESDDVDYTYRILVDGETHYFNAHIVKVSKENEPLKIVMGFRNIDSIVAEQEKSKKLLEDALNASEHANRAKTTFLNSMSHDIRTPMNAIIGFTSLAATHIDNKELVKQYLSKIQVSSNHLLSLINDVLDMSRIESGKVKIVENEVHLPDVLHDLRTIVQADVKAKQIDFFIDTMDVADEDIICDKLRLNQVLLNIVSNAIKFTPAGGSVNVKVIETGNAPEGYAAYTFKVKDSGIGMSAEFVEHIFEPFTRAQTATVSGIQGTGLGMAITKNIVDMMGGSISVKSTEGVGSEFTVELTFRKSAEKISYSPIPELTGAPALVVDDDLDCCVSVCKMLTEIGMRPEWTSSGREAVVRTQYACDRNDPFSVYIIDWLMPDVNGIETVRRIRRIIGEQKPIIVLTSYDWEDVEAEAREAGVTAFCSKPIFMSELRKVLSEPYEAPAEESVSEEKVDFGGTKLLLVEDNEMNREIAMDILGDAGFSVDVAEDGTIAVEKMSAAKPGQYDAILMDIQMPIMDGYEATRQIRKLPDADVASIPIIAMTANAFEEDKKLAFEAGMNAHVAKPINIPVLMETLEQLLSK